MNDKDLQKDFSLISLTLLNNVEDKNQYKEERKSKIDKILKNNFILPNVLLLLFFFLPQTTKFASQEEFKLYCPGPAESYCKPLNLIFLSGSSAKIIFPFFKI